MEDCDRAGNIYTLILIGVIILAIIILGLMSMVETHEECVVLPAGNFIGQHLSIESNGSFLQEYFGLYEHERVKIRDANGTIKVCRHTRPFEK